MIRDMIRHRAIEHTAQYLYGSLLFETPAVAKKKKTLLLGSVGGGISILHPPAENLSLSSPAYKNTHSSGPMECGCIIRRI